ncbi:hypothetical protein fugu_004341 [Takifugu bimaculatus]|uniref:cGMP-dependent protein kinase n=1 Tax=Takifugu bimaculatus TaxID=433685 RepID=A0A4Z2BE93_9TELE|nr:hypothetical protein fugu_004341 [Takifugu bimaculatus]
MGNASMKSKRYKNADGSVTASNSWSHRDGRRLKNASLESLRVRVEELEREGKRRDEELQAKEQQIRSLQEQLARQTRVLAELSEELQTKCIQLSKLQDVMKSQGGAGTASRPTSVRKAGKSSPNLSVRIKETLNRRKGAKAGVSAEPTSSSLPKFCFEKARVAKDVSVKKLLTDALNKNQYLRRLELQQIKDIVECMYERTYQRGEYVVKQGEPGNHLFVLADGTLDVFQHNKLLTSITVWTTFGELAILYNCTRTASRSTDVRTWALDREVFQNIMRRTAEMRHEQYRNFLRSVSLLANLPEDKLSKMVDCLEVEYYDKGEFIIREGEEGSTFYIIAQGKLQKGDYFGEKALVRTFDQTVGTFSELQKHLQGYVATLDRDDRKRHASPVSRHQSQPLSSDAICLKEMVSTFSASRPFDHLEVVATLGVGGFGRVELVKMQDKDVAFALKIIKKKHVVDNRQEEHIQSERKILAEARSPFIVKLYRTFKDNKYVYMLLEACLGGEVWSLLRDRGNFEEPTAKFCVGCVTEAFDYLHRKGILYRDLKPENLLLDAEGYIKLVSWSTLVLPKRSDVARRPGRSVGPRNTWRPEIILNKGHNFSVDFWSLGILVFELLTGSPPFSGSDQMMTYTFILKGIEKMDFPKKITKRPEDLIRKLCRQNPAERLGNLKNGITDIKKHRWFNGFSWEGLKAKTLPSPLKRALTGPTDHSYFDSYPPDEDSPPDELSGWDVDF